MCQLYRVTTLEQQVTYSHYAGGGAELMVNLVATLGLVVLIDITYQLQLPTGLLLPP